MNPRWEVFRSGAAFYIGHAKPRRGKPVPVFVRRPRGPGRLPAPRLVRLFTK